MSAESQEPTSEAPESSNPEDRGSGAPVGVSPTDRARALLRGRAYGRAWRAQAVGTLGDRLALLTLLALTVRAVIGAQALGGGYSATLLALAAAFGARLLGTLLFGAVLLAPLAQLTRRLDRRQLLLGAEAARAALLACALFWVTWAGTHAWIWLLVTVFVAAALERVVTVTRESFAEALLPSATPGHAPVDQRPVLRHIDLWTGYATIPLAALGFVVLMLLNQGIGQGVSWLSAHPLALAGFGAAALFAAAGALYFRQELPDAEADGPRPFEPRSPLTNLRAPGDVTPGLAARGRTGSSLVFSFAACSVAAAVAAAVAVAYIHAFDLLAGEIGFGLLVLALTAGLLLGLRVSRSVLPPLSRRRLLPLAMIVSGLGLVLGGLVRDYVLALVLFSLAGIAGGVAFRGARDLLRLETEEARQPKVDEHLHAMLRVAVALALLVSPLIGAAFGPEQFGGTTLTFDHGGAGLAVALAGLLLVVAGVVVLLRGDDRKGVAPLPRDVWDAFTAGAERPAYRAGTGFFIALEGGDGAGKSTQAQALSEWIRSKGHEVVLTREPGGSAIGQRLRAMLLDVSNTGISHRAEALIFAADRAEHVDSVILPALECGAVVITDRYMDSSIAYQGAGRDLAAADVARINRWATGGLVPDLTVVLDVAPSAARERFTDAPDRMESEPETFHRRVRSAFLALAAADPARYLIVDAGQPPHAVTTAIRHRLDRELPLSEQEKAALAERERLAREAEARRLEEEARRKAEEERAERERQATLERLRLEAEEAEKARQAEEDRKAAEAARQAAEAARAAAAAEAARRAEEEAERRRAEEAARAAALAEADRLAELERQRAEKRAEERRRAEDALQRAEASRLAAEATAAAVAAAAATKARGAEPQDGGAEHIAADRNANDATAVLPRVTAEPNGTDGVAATAELPQVGVGVGMGSADETAVLPRVTDAGPAPDAVDATAELPRVTDPREPAGGAAAARKGDEPGAGRDASEVAGRASGAARAGLVAGAAGPAAGNGDELGAGRRDDTAGRGGSAADAPKASPAATAPGGGARAGQAPAPGGKAAADETAVLPRVVLGGEVGDKAESPVETTAPLPVVDGAVGTGTPQEVRAPKGGASPAAAEETMVLPPMPARPPVVGAPAPQTEEAPKKSRLGRFTRKSGAAQEEAPGGDTAGTSSAVEETAVLPVVDPQAQQPLPRSWRESAPRSAESVQDRVPEWLFRPEPGPAGAESPTAQIPAVEPRAEAAPAQPGRYDWAEETPLDDLPSLTDQLLGTREEWAHWHAETPDEEQGPDDRGRHG
ncbi:dTMP kinase [Streptacidiphilus sp. MAP12-33]|uniref:dTMP kinase n=1 Tax=Streptacidiphilus sp. MAP12-33 TaxID=3156266 RepID=UPI003518C2C6